MQLSIAPVSVSRVSVLHEKRIYGRVYGHRQAAHRPMRRSSVNGSNHTRCATPEPFSEPFTLHQRILRPLCSTVATVVLVCWLWRRSWPAMHATPRHLITRNWWAITNLRACEGPECGYYCGRADHVPCLCPGHERLFYLQPVSGTRGSITANDSITP